MRAWPIRKQHLMQIFWVSPLAKFGMTRKERKIQIGEIRHNADHFADCTQPNSRLHLNALLFPNSNLKESKSRLETNFNHLSKRMQRHRTSKHWIGWKTHAMNLAFYFFVAVITQWLKIAKNVSFFNLISAAFWLVNSS